jgi:hypothetical protein
MKRLLTVLLLLPLVGCASPVYNGWNLKAAAESFSVAESNCALNAGNQPGAGIAWSNCLIEAGRKFSADISLSRPALYANYADNIGALGVRLENRSITRGDFQVQERGYRDAFARSVLMAERSQQAQNNETFLTGMTAFGTGAALGASQPSVVAGPDPMARPVRAVRSDEPVQAAPPFQPKPIPPASTTIVNCSGVVTGVLVSGSCREN